MWEELINSIDRFGYRVGSLINNFVDIFRSVFSALGTALGFIVDLIMFLLYGVRSLLLLLWNTLYSIFNGFVDLFTQLLSTFNDLSVFMGSTTALLIDLFVIVLLLIIFQFLLRFFLGKFHYNRVTKK